MNGIGGLGRPAEAEIISFLVCYLPFFCSRYQGLLYKRNQQIRFHGSEKYSGFPFVVTRTDGRETVMEKLACNTTRSAVTIMLVGFGPELELE